ncbi:MAG TPA: hypothetical protein VFN87_10520 [Solirubrobacteraceae bacterium]|nr:hypothetical protein [Solirubrobacteraceae bacterium]
MRPPTADSPGVKPLGETRRGLSDVEERIGEQRILVALDEVCGPRERLRARRAARLLQAYELLVWDASAEGVA